MIEGLDSRLINFVTENARYVRPLNTADRVHLTLDWDSESWRAPLHYDREAIIFGAGGVMTVTGTMLAGDVIAEAVMGMLGAVVGETLIAAEATAGGAAAGLGVHGAVNYFREHVGRDQFVADSNAALDATIKTWHNMIAPKSDLLVDRWFNETKKLVQTPELDKKLGY